MNRLTPDEEKSLRAWLNRNPALNTTTADTASKLLAELDAVRLESTNAESRISAFMAQAKQDKAELIALAEENARLRADLDSAQARRGVAEGFERDLHSKLKAVESRLSRAIAALKDDKLILTDSLALLPSLGLWRGMAERRSVELSAVLKELEG